MAGRSTHGPAFGATSVPYTLNTKSTLNSEPYTLDTKLTLNSKPDGLTATLNFQPARQVRPQGLSRGDLALSVVGALLGQDSTPPLPDPHSASRYARDCISTRMPGTDSICQGLHSCLARTATPPPPPHTHTHTLTLRVTGQRGNSGAAVGTD